ncbi:MAG: sugar nucleotide-binding protein [Candidatus Roizmanbacteria bacterium]
MKKYTIAITGSTGLIGSRIIELLTGRFTFLPLRMEDGIDITDSVGLKSKVQSLPFDFLLHLAAYTNVDKAEIERELCHKINVDGTKNLLNICESKSAKMILISTDFVLDGSTPGPKDETATPHPLGYYAQTKYEAEQLVKGKGMIVRITTPYRDNFPGKKDIVRTIRSLLEEGKPLTMVIDNLVVPTAIDDIALALGYLIEHFSPEIYHVVGPEAMSSYDLAMRIADKWHLDKNLISKTTHAQYGHGKAPRPQYGNIVSRKNIGIKMSQFA